MTGLKPSGQLRAPSNRTGGEQDKQPVRVAHGRQGHRPARRRLSDAPGLAPKATLGREPAQRGPDVDEERQQEEPRPRRPWRRTRRDVTIEHVELQDTGVVVRNSRVAEENRAHAPAGRAEQIRPVTLDLPVLQQIQAEPVPVEAQARSKVADRHHGM
jgi:hypothetical protein